MQDRSNLYKQMMRSDLREVTTAAIYIGAVNQKAQSGAVAQGAFWELASPQAPMDSDKSVTKRYFTWEQKANRLDGERFFVPELDTEELFNNGIVTERLSTPEDPQAVVFLLGESGLDIKGLTIEFGESYPLTFRVESEAGVVEYVNTSGSFVTEDVFDNVSFIKIIPGEMSNGQTRFHIEKILFGIGIVLTGLEKIINIGIKEKVHPISLELPTVDMNFTVDNLDRYFNANAEDSAINFLEKGQKVELYFYQTLGDGSSETINGGTTMLESWKDKSSQAEFTATDRLWQMEGIYEEGIYRKEGVSAFTLLEDVFERAGFTEREYIIDPYLKNVLIRNPLPKDTYANCILLIANACRCEMRQDRQMKIIIKAAFAPELSTESGPGTEYSREDKLLEVIDVTEYFDWQQSYNRLDGTMFWKPEGEEPHYAGYVSKAISDQEGNFEDNPYIVMNAAAAFTFYQLSVSFGGVHPRRALIRCFNERQETDSFEVELSGNRQIINHSFIEVDSVRIEFTKAAPNSRIIVKNISVAEATDFILKRAEMLEEPTTERQDRIKDIVISRTVYSLPGKQDSIFMEDMIISTDENVFKLEFNDASIPVSINTTIPADENVTADENTEDIQVDYGAEILQYSNWYCTVRFNNPPAEPTEVHVEVIGFQYNVTNPEYVLPVNTTGVTPDTLQNPLVDSIEMAKQYAEWCAGYYAAKAEYTIPKYMGDPVLEAGDLAYYEDEDNRQQLIRVHTIQIKFDGTYNDSSCAGRSV